MWYILITMYSVANSPMSTYSKLSLLWYQCTIASQTLLVAQAPIASPPIIAGELVTAVHKLQTDYWPIKTVIFTLATNNIHDVIIIAAFKYLEHHIYPKLVSIEYTVHACPLRNIQCQICVLYTEYNGLSPMIIRMMYIIILIEVLITHTTPWGFR